jgi:uncharacterized membrane protein
MNQLRPFTFAILVLAGLAAGCGAETTPPPLVDCTMVTPQKYSALTIWSKCVSCHSSTLSGTARMMAPVGTNFDSFEAAKAKAGVAASRVNLGQMPPMGSTQPTPDEKAALLAWAVCGTPN